MNTARFFQLRATIFLDNCPHRKWSLKFGAWNGEGGREGRMRDGGRKNMTQGRSHGIRRPVSSPAGHHLHATILTPGYSVQIPMDPVAGHVPLR